MSDAKDSGQQDEFLDDGSKGIRDTEDDGSKGIRDTEDDGSEGIRDTEDDGSKGIRDTEDDGSKGIRDTEDDGSKGIRDTGDLPGDNDKAEAETDFESTSPEAKALSEADIPEKQRSPPVLLQADTPTPLEIAKAFSEFKGDDCFTKGCKWSPDGTCLLTNSNDNILRLWDLPSTWYSKSSWSCKISSIELKPSVSVREGGLVYDYAWYPLMSSWDPPTCCFVTASRGSPGHLWDAFTGTLRATYRAYNQVDEVEPARCVAFDPTGDRLYFGFNNNFRVFRTAIPGRDYVTRNLKTVSCDTQRGIVSCITVCPAEPDLFAVGTYLKSVGLYTESEENAVCILRGHEGGVTHLLFSPDGYRLYSGARMDSEILCWDLREPGKVLFSVARPVTTHQRVYFDLTPDGRYLLSGNMDGSICVWDTESPVSPDGGVLSSTKRLEAHDDCTNGVSVHPYYTILASCSGQRHFEGSVTFSDSSESEDENEEHQVTNSKRNCKRMKRECVKKDFSVKLWWTGAISEDVDS